MLVHQHIIWQVSDLKANALSPLRDSSGFSPDSLYETHDIVLHQTMWRNICYPSKESRPIFSMVAKLKPPSC